MRRLPVALLVCLGATGCARALKQPPELSALGGPQPPAGAVSSPASGVPALLSQAEVLYTSRDPEQVRQAAHLWLDAARADATRTEGLVGSVRALSWLIDHSPDPNQRRDDAVLAVQSAQWCGRIEPGSPVCDYWLGAALGLQARERHTTALDALPQIEDAFKRAAAGDPNQEDGGPDRALALLYLRAPGWPTGPGDPELGLQYARKAQEIAPDYPPNLLALGEALAAAEDAAGSRQAWQQALDLSRRRAAQHEPDAPEWIAEAEKALSSAPQDATPRRQ